MSLLQRCKCLVMTLQPAQIFCYPRAARKNGLQWKIFLTQLPRFDL